MGIKEFLAASRKPRGDLRSWQNDSGQIWLNVASSHVTLPGFVNIDSGLFFRFAHIYPLLRSFAFFPRLGTLETYWKAIAQHKTLFADCRRPLPFPAQSVDHVLCSHFLEHVYPDEADQVLSGFYQILKPGGTLHVVVPDLKEIVDRYLVSFGREVASDDLVRETGMSLVHAPSLRYRLLEASGLFGLQHRWMFDRSAIEAKMRRAGFVVGNKATLPSAQFEKEGVHVHAAKG